MGYFMNSQKKVLVRSCSNNICHKKELAREYRGRLQDICAENLQGNHGEDDIFGQRFWTAEFDNLGSSNEHVLYTLMTSSIEVTSGWALIIWCLRVRWGSS